MLSNKISLLAATINRDAPLSAIFASTRRGRDVPNRAERRLCATL